MKKINIMIVFYSAIQPDRDTKELTVKPPAAYDCRLDDRFRAQYVNGRFTQEAPVYAVAKMLKEQGKSIDYLYGFATTDERRANVRIALRANEEPVPFADQRAFFREAMRETCADLARTEFRFLDFDYPTETLDEECNRRAVEAAMRIKQDMKADGHDWADCSLYIDLTGGPRAADMVLSHFCRSFFSARARNQKTMGKAPCVCRSADAGRCYVGVRSGSSRPHRTYR